MYNIYRCISTSFLQAGIQNIEMKKKFLFQQLMLQCLYAAEMYKKGGCE